MTDDELRRVYSIACSNFSDNNNGDSGMDAGLRAIATAAYTRAAEVAAKYSGSAAQAIERELK